MNVYKMLNVLTSSDDDRAESFDDKLARKLSEITPLLTDGMKVKMSGLSVRAKYLQALTCILRTIVKLNITNVDAPFSVNQYRSLKIAVELMVSIGIVPCLLCGVGVDVTKLCPRASEIFQENLSCMEKYKRLTFTIHALTEFFGDQSLQPAILLHLGPIIAALLQLSHAPLIKPTSENEQRLEKIVNKEQFRMTVKEYQKLQGHQKQFYIKLILLLSNCPQYMCIRELMVIHGMQDSPKWLRRCTRSFLINKIIQPGGVLSLITAVWDNGLDTGVDWSKLDTISRLLATSHGENAEEYYRAVCPQVVDLLSSDKIKYGSTIANYYIAVLHDCNPSVCHEYIVQVMCAPLIMIESFTARSEREIERCIKCLVKCFLAEDAKFKYPSCKLILHVAVPLFCLYNKVRRTHCVLKKHLQQLLLKILEGNTKQEELYSAFLGHDIATEFGDYVVSVFGPTGGIEITGLDEDLKYEELAETIFDLASTAKDLSPNIFCYILKFLSSINKLNNRIGQREILETGNDKMGRIEMQLAAYMLLSKLADTNIVQEAQAKKPEPLLSFIKLLFNEYTKEKDGTEDGKYEILYLSLMLIKIILIEKKACLEINFFKDFSIFLKQCANSRMPTQLKSLINEIVECVDTHGRSSIFFDRRHYQDLSINSTASNKFEEALRDLADPLLPVRAHGLVTLTRLIESQDSCVDAHKILILRLFQEHLKNEDSFIYLASINGMCALATAFPQVVIETLMPEYIDMPNRIAGTEITVETRIKLGEILVKTTRALGEMSVVHKSILVNGFLCAVRDTEHLVRASGLSCLGELCKVLGFRLGSILTEIVYCITCIIKQDRAPECRRAAVLVATLLFRGLGKDTLTNLSNNLVDLYRGLRHLRDKDDDLVLRLHAQLALEEIDEIVQQLLFVPPKLKKTIFLLNTPPKIT